MKRSQNIRILILTISLLLGACFHNGVVHPDDDTATHFPTPHAPRFKPQLLNDRRVIVNRAAGICVGLCLPILTSAPPRVKEIPHAQAIRPSSLLTSAA